MCWRSLGYDVGNPYTMVSIDINEAECHRNELLTAAVKLRPDVDARFRCVASWKLNHLNTPVQIECDKVARVACRVVVAYDGIDLEGARATIVQIVPRRIPPAYRQRQERPQHQHEDHAQAQEQQGVRTQHPSAPSTSPDQARRFRRRAGGGTASRTLLAIFFSLWRLETRGALRHPGDARLSLLAAITLDRTMAQRTARHGTVGRFEHRHVRLLSDRAKRQNDNNTRRNRPRKKNAEMERMKHKRHTAWDSEPLLMSIPEHPLTVQVPIRQFSPGH